ncbi:MAG TPA: DUF177 domain-containing protein [Candidatus Kapabacteria bacterium]|nr:DUF177 domain-containing protein [Candidatus Kapabacteria bacterium]
MFYTSRSLTFRLRGIREGVHPIDCSVEPNELEIPDATDPILVRGELKADDLYAFNLTIDSKQRHVCDRCTDEFDAAYHVPLAITYMPAGDGAEFEDTGYVHTFNPFDLYEVNISDDVHDALLLAVPMKKLCREDCPGIEIAQKNEQDIDERFRTLSTLYDKLKAEEQ